MIFTLLIEMVFMQRCEATDVCKRTAIAPLRVMNYCPLHPSVLVRAHEQVLCIRLVATGIIATSLLTVFYFK